MKYRKKPLEVEAIKLCKYIDEECAEWCNGEVFENGVKIKTPEGTMSAIFGDFIIKGIAGEFYPCKPDIFKKTYDTIF